MKVGKWKVRRTHEEWPCEQYEVVRVVAAGDDRPCVEVYQYADTREEAQALANEANRSGR